MLLLVGPRLSPKWGRQQCGLQPYRGAAQRRGGRGFAGWRIPSASAADRILYMAAAGDRGNTPLSGRGSDDDGASNESVELELYKLAVEMADRISARRALANTFFLTVNTGLVALLGGKNLRWYVAAAGIVFAFAWWSLLQSYRKLNSAKFEVINTLERRLPVQLFSDEWDHLENTKAPPSLWPPRALWAWLQGYHELGTAERVVPIAFVVIYVAELIRQAAT